VNARDVFLTIERAVPCGLIFTELLSNALKHAFPADRAGEIVVDLGPQAGSIYKMTIGDNGVGLPPGVDPRRAASLGLRIVNTLTEQLGGTIQVSNDEGATFTLVFPMEEEDGAAEPRIVTNLVCNALKFTPAGGKVTVASAARDGTVVASVSDTGPGLEPDALPSLFDRYQNTTSAKHGGGTGLGLFIVKTLAEAQAGRVEVTSAPGKGTTFSVLLPTAGASKL